MGRRESNKADKLRRIELAGLGTFLRDGYAAASVETIAASADVARGTFYLYFKNKETLFASLVSQVFGPLDTTIAAAQQALSAEPGRDDASRAYAALSVRLAQIVAEHRDPLRLAFAEARSAGAGGEIVRREIAGIEQRVEAVLADAVERGILRPHHTRAVALAIVGGIEKLTWHYLEGDPTIDVATLAAEMTRLFRHGLAG